MLTQEQKREYYKQLRNDWVISKEMAEKDEKAKALFRETNYKGVSYYGFYFTLMQMRKLGLKGLPYIDCKTFNKWKEAGFRVRKGEHSKIRGIAWMKVRTKTNPKSLKSNAKIKEDDDTFMYPKKYNLFHTSQVVEL